MSVEFTLNGRRYSKLHCVRAGFPSLSSRACSQAIPTDHPIRTTLPIYAYIKKVSLATYIYKHANKRSTVPTETNIDGGFWTCALKKWGQVFTRVGLLVNLYSVAGERFENPAINNELSLA